MVTILIEDSEFGKQLYNKVLDNYGLPKKMDQRAEGTKVIDENYYDINDVEMITDVERRGLKDVVISNVRLQGSSEGIKDIVSTLGLENLAEGKK